MTVGPAQLVFYGGSGASNTDVGAVGGDIDSGIRIAMNDISSNTTVTTYSSDIRDRNRLKVWGWDSSQLGATEIITVSGTGSFVGSTTFSGVLGAALINHATGVGIVTVSGTSQNVIGRIPVGESGFRAPFWDATGVPGSEVSYYEKVFIKNNSKNSTLQNATIIQPATGLSSIITYGLENGKSVDPSGAGTKESVANRKTAPINVSSYGSGVSGVWPSGSGNLEPTAYQGVWLKMTLPDGYVTTTGFYQIYCSGNS